MEREGIQGVKITKNARKIDGESRTRGHIQVPINLHGHGVAYKLTFVYNYKNHGEDQMKHQIEFVFDVGISVHKK